MQEVRRFYPEIRGCGSTDDAYHVTVPHPEGRGAIACMKQAIAEAGINPSDIGYINAHGTATNKGDTVETSSIKKVFGNTLPYVSSTKGATGHMMGPAVLQKQLPVSRLLKQAQFRLQSISTRLIPNVPALTLLQILQKKPKSTLPCQTHSDSAVRTQVLS